MDEQGTLVKKTLEHTFSRMFRVDMEWLDSVNAERKKEQADRVSCEAFEIIMDRLEKDWFDLVRSNYIYFPAFAPELCRQTKNLPKPEMAMPSEDSTCAICDDSEGENTNAIVFCDGCNLAVHQDCYGVPYIPEGQWLCRKCTVSPETPVVRLQSLRYLEGTLTAFASQSCILCPNEGGAFKQTVLGDWVHLLCAIWIPETRVMNETFMEPITDADKIPKQRWKLVRYLTVRTLPPTNTSSIEMLGVRHTGRRMHSV